MSEILNYPSTPVYPEKQHSSFQTVSLIPQLLLDQGLFQNKPEIKIPRNEEGQNLAFIPDTWTGTFFKGLYHNINFGNKAVLEVGAGAGTLQNLFLSLNDQSKIPSQFYATEYNADLIPLAQSNTYSANNYLNGDFNKVLFYQGDLLSDFKQDTQALNETNHIIACIPQVRLPDATKLEIFARDNSAHYYQSFGYNSENYKKYNNLGLGLNYKLLKQTSDLIKEGKLSNFESIILNLGGRPGKENLISLFSDLGFTPKIIQETVIPQHLETSILPLLEQEKDGITKFEFFSDPEGTKEITATEADKLRTEHNQIYHKIYVIEGARDYNIS